MKHKLEDCILNYQYREEDNSMKNKMRRQKMEQEYEK